MNKYYINLDYILLKKILVLINVFIVLFTKLIVK